MRRSRSTSRGASAIECMVALGIITILVSAAMDGVSAHARAGALTKDALRVRSAASSRLETAPTRALSPGRRPFETEGLSGVEEVREVAPGLLEVAVRVQAPSGAATQMTTRVAVEGRKP